MCVIRHKKVIEITGYLPGRGHVSIEFKFGVIRKCRKNSRQHGSLDRSGHVQFCADTFPVGSNSCNILCIIDDTCLHGSDLMIKITDLVIGTDGEVYHVFLSQLIIIFRKGG